LLASLRRESNSFVFGLLLHRGKKIHGSLVWFRRFFPHATWFSYSRESPCHAGMFHNIFVCKSGIGTGTASEQGAKHENNDPARPTTGPETHIRSHRTTGVSNRSWIRRTLDTHVRFHDVFGMFHGMFWCLRYVSRYCMYVSPAEIQGLKKVISLEIRVHPRIHQSVSLVQGRQIGKHDDAVGTPVPFRPPHGSCLHVTNDGLQCRRSPRRKVACRCNPPRPPPCSGESRAPLW